jgi:hypothetical protein
VTAATKPTTETADALRTLQTAADAIEDAIARIDPSRHAAVCMGEKLLSLELAALASQLHADEHDGPIRWCRYELCKKADEVLRDA